MKIGFGCNMGTGKDISVSYLIEKYGGIKLSFAEPVYDILNYAQKTCSFSQEKDRKFLQFIGTDWAREINENVWIDILLKKIINCNENIYVSDIRFLNELEALKNNNFICIKLVRNINIDRIGTGSYSHISENSIEDKYWDFVIDNNGTLEELYIKIDNILLKYQ